MNNRARGDFCAKGLYELLIVLGRQQRDELSAHPTMPYFELEVALLHNLRSPSP